MSASWVLVLSFGFSTLILSKNQSRATLWVLDTCLIVGLCPWIIILITASLSSKMNSSDSLRQECVPRWRTPPCWAWWPAWRWWLLLAFWFLRLRKVVENVAFPRILSVQDPVCCFDESLISLEFKVLFVSQHIEDSLEFWLLLCIHDLARFFESRLRTWIMLLYRALCQWGASWLMSKCWMKSRYLIHSHVQ